MSFKHEYFEDGLFRSLEISYAEDTLKLMHDLQIVIKPFKGGFHLLSARPELLAARSDDNPLRLYLSCKDPYYINYTVLPGYAPSSSLIYFNNLGIDSAENESELKLHDEFYVSRQNVFRLTHGEFMIDSFDSNKTYTFKQANEDMIPDQFITEKSPDSGNMIINNLHQGVVRVFDGNVVVDSLYYYPNAVWRKPLGVIEIFTNELSNHCDIKKNPVENRIEFTKTDYSVDFNNRKTIWKYFLVSEEYKRFKNLTIINSAREQIFELANEDAESLVLISKNKLPLSEQPTDLFQLVDNFIPGQRIETVVLNYLVKPSPEQLHYDSHSPNQTIYSHVYL